MRNKKGGFLQLIIIIVVAFLLLRYFNITVAQILGYVSQAIDWLKGLFNSVQ